MLDLKYRPRKFSEVLGNEGVKKLLLIRSKGGTLADQSMMFGGPKGCGKTTFARLVARSMMCTNLDDGEPCGECPMCSSILNETCQAVQELDAASQGTVDRIRTMVHDADYETMDGSGIHVYVVDEAQRLSKPAQDALLKAVEERMLIVILCTTEPHKIRGPIRDRMEEYPVSAPSENELIMKMQAICHTEGIAYEAGGLEIIVRMNRCTPRSSYLSLASVSALGDATADSVRQFFRFDSYGLVDRILCLVDSDPAAAFQCLDKLSLHESPSWIRDMIVFAISNGLRQDVGARAGYPVPIHFFRIRARRWCDLAVSLGAVDRPSMADIEAMLLSDSPAIVDTKGSLPVRLPPLEIQVSPSLDPPAEKALDPPAEKALDPPKAPTGKDPSIPKEIDVDGVRFSQDENLTSLDAKVGKADKPGVQEEPDVVEVGLNQDRTPISEKQFISGFLHRLKRSE